MDSNEIRVGKISSVDYTSGTVRVVYEDQDDAVTRPIPLLSFEYLMPEVDDMVLVLHLSNGTEAGVVIGRPWSDQRVPPESGQGLYRKDFHNEVGKAFLRFSEKDNETMTLHVKNLVIEAENVTAKAEKDIVLDATGNVTIKAAGALTVKGSSATIDAPATSVTGSMTVAQDATASGISVAHHTHTTPHGVSGAPQ
jgi:phage baseplate assembly protein V